MDGKITLDLAAFKALAADTRVSILKSLGKRRKTLSELAEEQGLGASTVKEHLEVLQKAELVKQFDDGHKWKYWELSAKGKKIVYPEETQILIVLSGSVIALLAGMYLLIGKFNSMIPGFQDYATPTLMGAPAPAGVAADAGERMLTAAAENVAQKSAESAATNASAAFAFPYIEIIVIVCAAILIGFCISYFMGRNSKI